MSKEQTKGQEQQEQQEQSKEQQEQSKEQIREQVEAKLQELQAEAQTSIRATGSTLSKADQGIATALQKGKVLSFKGKGAQGFYFIAYRGKPISKVTRVEGNTFKGQFTNKEGVRQEVAIAEIKYLREVGIEINL